MFFSKHTPCVQATAQVVQGLSSHQALVVDGIVPTVHGTVSEETVPPFDLLRATPPCLLAAADMLSLLLWWATSVSDSLDDLVRATWWALEPLLPHHARRQSSVCPSLLRLSSEDHQPLIRRHLPQVALRDPAITSATAKALPTERAAH